jgi:hypothetical protein
MGSIDIVTLVFMFAVMIILDLIGMYRNGGIFYFFSIILGLIFITIEGTSSGIVINSTITASPYPYTLVLFVFELIPVLLTFEGKSK